MQNTIKLYFIVLYINLKKDYVYYRIVTAYL